ncbi:MAG TPA: DUF4159 domain-containing protein [Vicinamibacterales bacterium]|nr:DUF4159 domain-containing protein [Vicinamibacterales bacterium]
MANGLRRLAIAAVLAALTTSAFAQFGRGFGGRARMRLPTASSYDGGFNFCRGVYRSGRPDGSGNGWTTDYPDADINFSIRLSELTKTTISRQAGDDGPNHLTVPITDPFLYQCPFLMMTDVGELSLSAQEAEILRRYFDKGGFLWVDDFWGSRSWDAFEREIGAVLPPAQFPIRDLDPAHPIFRTLYDVRRLPQIPSINSWRGMDGGTSELGEDSAEPHIRAITDRDGRMMVLITHNTDISDAWEREAADPQYFLEFSPNGYAVGLNVVLYALTH